MRINDLYLAHCIIMAECFTKLSNFTKAALIPLGFENVQVILKGESLDRVAIECTCMGAFLHLEFVEPDKRQLVITQLNGVLIRSKPFATFEELQRALIIDKAREESGEVLLLVPSEPS